MDDSQVLGIIFPLLPQHIQRFLEGHKTVFVKFFGKERIPLRLEPGNLLFMYESQGRKEIAGEGRITRIETCPVSEVITRFGDRLFLNQAEFKHYAGDRVDRQMLVLVLDHVKRYSVPLTLGKPVTMAGRYMTLEMYREIRGKPSEIELRTR